MASLHKKRRIEMKQLYDEYCQYVAEPMSEEEWFRMTIMKGKLTLSEAKRHYDPRKVRKAKAEKRKSEESTKKAEEKKADKAPEKEEKSDSEGEVEKEKDEEVAKEKEEEVAETEGEVAEKEEGEEKSELEKAYEAEDYNALGKALKDEVEKVPASKDDRLKAAKEILEKGE